MGKVVKVVIGVVVAVGIIALAAPTGGLSLGLAAALGTSAAVASAIIGVGLTLVAGIAMKALGLTPRIGTPSAGNAAPTIFRQAIAESHIVYGKRRVGGLIVFFHPRTVGGLYYRYFVIAHCGHQVQGNPVWMLNDEIVTVNSGTGLVTSGPYANAAWLWFGRGTASETANADFVAECAGKWTTAHKGNGVAKTYARFKMTDEVIQAGMPNITVIIDGRDEVRDPRTDTIGYSRNASMIFNDWMQMPREEGGFGAYADEMPDDVWQSAQANVCDETVPAEVGTEARYALDAVIVTGSAPSDIRDTLVVNCAGSFTYSSGVFLMRPGYYVPSMHTLTEGDVASAITVSPFDSGDSTANQVAGVYVSPDQGYSGAAFNTQGAPLTDIRQMDLDLPFVTSRYRAERIASIMLRRALAEKSVTWPMNLAGLPVGTLDSVTLDTSRYNLSNYEFTVRNWDITADYGIVLSLREENAEIYDEPTHYAVGAVPTIDSATPISTGQVSISLPTVLTYPADYLGNIVTLDPDVISPLVTQSGVSLKLSDATNYSVSVAGVTGMLDNTNGSSTKGNYTLTSIDSNFASVTYTITVNGVTFPPITVPIQKQIGVPPSLGGSGSKIASDNSFNAINTTSYVAITDTIIVTLASGESLYGTAPLDYNVSASGGIVEARTATAQWEYRLVGAGSWLNMGTGITGSLAYSSGNTGGFEPEPIAAVPGHGDFNQSVGGLTAGDYECRLSAHTNTTGRDVTFNGVATIEAKV
ncbi:MAG TPA: phage tail protein [Gammaproteobacteria bacterium]|nr:phage tail protein [Gammaproteobacteria bacterium]